MIHSSHLTAVIVSVGCFLQSSVFEIRADVYNVTVPPRQQDAYQNAHYRLWIPDDVRLVRGIIFRQHGCGPGARKFGLEHADDIQFRALARKWDCALMGSQLWAPQEDCSTWTIPDDGSAHAFLTALKKFAQRSGHPEIDRVPWVLWGHSGGAMWVSNMTYGFPERIIAVFPRSGGLAPPGREFKRSQPATPDSNAAALRVPVLFCYGEQEAQPDGRFYGAVSGTHAVYDYGRARDAVWSVAAHPKSSHENSNSRLLAIRFFDAALARRLPKLDAVPRAPVKPLPIDHDAGWFGDPKTLKIQAVAGFSGDRAAQAWLPDEATARAWLQFITAGTINDTTPPPAPTHVGLKTTAEAIVITWQAEADIESGIHAFNIYRDGKQIGSVAGPVIKRWNPNGHYHAWNYSDQPLPETGLAPLRFEDRTDGRSATADYRVTTVNQANLESPRSGRAQVNDKSKAGLSVVPRPVFRTVLQNAGHGGAEEFPDVVKLSNGDVFCVFYEGYAHVSTPNERFPTGGRIMAIRSHDDGRTWSDPMTVADTAWDDRDPSVMEASPGRLRCNFFATFGASDNEDTLGLFLVESDDRGHTWSTPRRLRADLSRPHASALACSSPIRKLSDASVILPAYFEQGSEACGVTARSTDEGRTWVDWVFVGREQAALHLDAETDIVELRDGSLYAVLRRSRHCGYWAVSRDQGKSWGQAQPLGFPANWPYLLRTRQGILLLDSGGRMSPDAPYTGNVLRYSTNEGRTWSEPTIVDKSGGGYASMAELDDGTILYIHYVNEPGNLRQTYFRVDREHGIEWLSD